MFQICKGYYKLHRVCTRYTSLFLHTCAFIVTVCPSFTRDTLKILCLIIAPFYSFNVNRFYTRSPSLFLQTYVFIVQTFYKRDTQPNHCQEMNPMPMVERFCGRLFNADSEMH